MSWLFGTVQRTLSPELKRRLETITPQPATVVSSASTYITAGGLKETLIYTSQGRDTGWAVVGTGIRMVENGCVLLTRQDWQDILSSGMPALDSVDGHFCAVRWTEGAIEVWTDEIGLRVMYIAPLEQGYCFSTRLDWVAQATGLSEPSFPEIGSAWFLTNKMTYGCLVQGVTRVGPGGRASITHSSLRSRNVRWRPEISDKGNDLLRTLGCFVQPRLPGEKTLALGLSGGFDCRMLLGVLGSQRRRHFSVYTFGSSEHPDVFLAKRIARDLGVQIDHYNDPLPPPDHLIALLKDYTAQTCLVSPASAIVKLRYYGQMHARGQIIIDGGFGEISRRQMANRLLHKGKKVLRDADPGTLFDAMRLYRSPVFTGEVTGRMRDAALQEIAVAWSEMPPMEEIGVENFVDLFSVVTRVANNSPGPQDWIDGYVQNYMPYAQPSFLREVFRTPVAMRKNGTLYRRSLQDLNPRLTKYPLAKEGVMYPFFLGSIPAWSWRSVKELAGRKYDERYAEAVLLHLREFVLDTLHATSTRSYDPYDFAAIERMVGRFYAGSRELAPQVDWWLTFELWKQSLVRS